MTIADVEVAMTLVKVAHELGVPLLAVRDALDELQAKGYIKQRTLGGDWVLRSPSERTAR